MQESHGEGVAIHTGPESCVGVRKDDREALTGERTGRVFSRERATLRDADAVGASGRPHPGQSIPQDALESRAVSDPEHVRTHLVRDPGEPVFARCG